MNKSAKNKEFNEQKAEEFADSVARTINAGAVSLMLSIGHKLALFDLLADAPHCTSQQLAERANLAERYLREWLAVMVVAQIVDYHPADQTYILPPEHAVYLTRASATDNLAVYAQYLPLMAGVYDKLPELFKTGKGLPYHEFTGFHDLMEEDSSLTVVSQLQEAILPLAADIPKRLQKGIDVLDAGCGKGRALMKMAVANPNSRFTGYDLCTEAIEQAQRSAMKAGLKNVQFEIFDLSNFNESDRYDLITSFDAVHDQKDPEKFLRDVYRALRPGGVHLMQDIGGSAYLERNHNFPMAALLYTISCFHCTPVSLAQGGAGLGTMWGRETAAKMLEKAGFATVEQKVFEHDPMNIWFVSRKITT